MKLAEVVLVVLVVTLVSTAFVIGWGIGNKTLTWGDVQDLVGIEQNNYNCTNLTLTKTTQCLRGELSSWWQYNSSNINKTLTEAELKVQGGVCAHASKWYFEQAESLGFKGEVIKFWGNKEIGHAFALLYDKNITEYCILDQEVIIGCSKLF